MLNIFPDLLTFSFFAPTLLRLVAAVAFGYIAYVQIKRRAEIATIKLPFIGEPGQTLVWVVAIVSGAIGFALLIGYYTQLAALFGLVVSLKHALYAKKYARAVPLCRADYYFLSVILLSLLLTGAGALAVDIRL